MAGHFLRGNPLPWLLEPDQENPAVRSFALRDLLGQAEEDAEVSGEGGRGSPTYHLIILPPTASKQECMTIIQRKLDGENLSLAEK